ncbi:hypothetical protein ACE01N_15910 [Saccharicrinis sp. FJH2]|uniref:hypothetical protein n=1 Tax=Saccharicrinis sp. FJH65 TaxID=3344659 RepID=UPI0035F352B9
MNVTLLKSENETEKYISKTLERLDKLLTKGTFTDGYVFMNNDTIATKLLAFKGRAKSNYYLFCISKDASDSVKVYRANEIKGYQIDDNLYLSHSSQGSDFFIQKIKSGRVDLYERDYIPSDKHFLYYLKFPQYNDLMVISPYEDNFKVWEYDRNSSSGVRGQQTAIIESKKIHQKFKVFINQYFGDCGTVVNLVQAEIFFIADLPEIVETFNNCDKN